MNPQALLAPNLEKVFGYSLCCMVLRAPLQKSSMCLYGVSVFVHVPLVYGGSIKTDVKKDGDCCARLSFMSINKNTTTNVTVSSYLLDYISDQTADSQCWILLIFETVFCTTIYMFEHYLF